MSDEYLDEPPELFRTPSATAERCIVLYAVVAAGHGDPRENLMNWLRGEGIWQAVTPKEAAFLRSQVPDERQVINATWRAEALFPLLWALQHVPALSVPTELCDIPFIRSVLPDLFSPVTEFIAAAQLRADTELRQANDDIYRIHWAVRDAQIHGKPIPDGYHPGVVQERHYALNWLIGYCNQDWDNISTDT